MLKVLAVLVCCLAAWWTRPALQPQGEEVACTAPAAAGGEHALCPQRLVAAGTSSNEWSPVGARLHLVTGRHADETRGYVVRIRSLQLRLSHPP